MVEGDVVTCGEDEVKGMTGCVGGCFDELCEAEVGEVFSQGGGIGVIVVIEVKVQVPAEDVVRAGECVGAGQVGDGVAERCCGSWGSIDECSSERVVGVRTWK
ncbi:hypothetical protein NDU88_007968 [Pleurodeles waltl]|uniref:Uncharacterized protein n=1 Tax=Pleurodeles waltl TaxID=8319 RepID=A0AAV7QR97_PLEWA|nr:hypothetical protein NDU88_007968 [Pleurodeles waltl]